ncbi:MAG: hypothetical protein HWQ38_23495 [Nostoc sp. NMS7]|uniref:hypothetical protein n=1 Tax=Nostoc sp. NMS7 TaxID=2815391 RepID=UPI002600C13B|nr:hypothetical protein [Nostoc sp. NMS7]MBN3949262.1 hypothetical protein [Nostoc sp. NMS7]
MTNNSKAPTNTIVRKSTRPALVGEFHIHIDAQTLSTPFEKFLIETHNFWNSDFSGHPEGLAHRPPKKHLTIKTKYASQLRENFASILRYLEENSEAIEGYIEAEYIPVDVEIKEKSFNPEIEIPFKLNLASLAPGTFRQEELHITLSREQSDPRLINSLRDMGFYSVYMEKSFGEVEIFTAQGTRKIIRQLLPEVITYLTAVGGAVQCSVKEERIIRWWMSSPELLLPSIINTVES